MSPRHSQKSKLVLNVQRLQQLGEKFLSPEGALPVAGYDDSWQVEGGVPAHRVSETFGLGHRTKSSKSGRSFFGRKFNFFEVFPLIRDIFLYLVGIPSIQFQTYAWVLAFSNWVAAAIDWIRVNLNRTSERLGALDYRRRLHLSSPPPLQRPEKIF